MNYPMEIDSNSTGTLEDVMPPVSIYMAYCAFNLIAFIINILQFFFLHIMPKVSGVDNFFFFLKNLSLMDAFMGILRVSLSNKPVQTYMYGARWLCVLSAVLIHSFLLIMSSLLLLVSIDRAIALKRGSQYSVMRFVIHFRKMTFCTMVLAFTMYAVIGTTSSSIGFEVKGMGACKMSTPKAPQLGMISVGANLINLLLIIAVYIYVLVLSKMALSTVKKSMESIIFTIGLIIVAKILFWCPIMVTVALRALKISDNISEWVGLLTMSLNSIANPLLYGITNRSFRRFVARKVRDSLLFDSMLL